MVMPLERRGLQRVKIKMKGNEKTGNGEELGKDNKRNKVPEDRR